MRRTVPAPRVALALAVASSVVGLVALGCGDDTGLPRRYPVSGKVTYKGEPVKEGLISFEPVDAAQGRAATGKIADGYYRLTTAVENDGALPGDYRVTIKSQTVDMSEVLAKAGGGAGRQDDIIKAQQKAVNNVPSKYMLADTSKLTAKVEEKSNTKDFELTD